MSWLRRTDGVSFPAPRSGKYLWNHSHDRFQTGFSLGVLASAVTKAAQALQRENPKPCAEAVDVELCIPAVPGWEQTQLRCAQQPPDSDSHCQDKARLGAVHSTCQALIQPFHTSSNLSLTGSAPAHRERLSPAGSTHTPE